MHIIELVICLNALYISGKEKMSNREEKRLIKYINNKKLCECVVLGKNLKKNINVINNCSIPIAEGRWLFKFLVMQTLEYICKCKNVEISNLSIALVSDINDELITYYIEELSKKTKKLKIVTGHRERFHNLEERLYYNEGIVLEISNNRKKALREVDVIFNFELEEEKMNKYKITEKAIIVNLKEKINIKSKRFDGINVNFYEIDFDNKLINNLDWIDEFEKTDIYESYLYRYDTIENIQKNIIKDKVQIKGLIGNNGVISEKEYEILLDKNYNLA